MVDLSRKISEELEFEKNKMALLKQMNVDLSDQRLSKGNASPRPAEAIQSANANGKYAWEYELEDYRKRKALEKFYFFGACCGIVSLIMTLILNYDKLAALF